MSFLSNLMTKMNLNREDEEDYDLDNDYDFDDDYEEEEESGGRPSFFSRRAEEDNEPKIRLFGKSKSAASDRKSSMEVTMIKPDSVPNMRRGLLTFLAVLPMPLTEIYRRFLLISLL